MFAQRDGSLNAMLRQTRHTEPITEVSHHTVIRHVIPSVTEVEIFGDQLSGKVVNGSVAITGVRIW